MGQHGRTAGRLKAVVEVTTGNVESPQHTQYPASTSKALRGAHSCRDIGLQQQQAHEQHFSRGATQPGREKAVADTDDGAAMIAASCYHCSNYCRRICTHQQDIVCFGGGHCSKRLGEYHGMHVDTVQQFFYMHKALSLSYIILDTASCTHKLYSQVFCAPVCCHCCPQRRRQCSSVCPRVLVMASHLRT